MEKTIKRVCYEKVASVRRLVNKERELEWVLRTYREGLQVPVRIRQVYYGEFAIHYEGNVINVEPVFNNTTPDRKYESVLNNYQYFLYLRAINGLKIYRQSEIKRMNGWEKDIINKVQEKSLSTLSLYLERALITISNKIFKQFGFNNRSRLFQHRLSEDNIEVWDQEEDFVMTLTFKDLFVTRLMIAKELVKREILPENFFELNERPKVDYINNVTIEN